MKIFIIAACLAALPVHSRTLAYSDNAGGGRIELHDTVWKSTKCKGYPLAKSWSNELSEDLLGCWQIDGSSVMVLWLQTGSIKSYSLEGWTIPQSAPVRRVPKHFDKDA